MNATSEKSRASIRKLILQPLGVKMIEMGSTRAILWVTGTAEVMAIVLGWLLIQIMGYSHGPSEAVYLATSTIPLIIAPLVGGTVVLLLEDVEEARQALQEISTRDGLTNLFNRTYFREKLQREISYAEVFQTPLSLLLFDADDFKQINDRYGHSVGDQVLESIAQTCMTLEIGERDVLARYGGEEFVLLLPETTEEGACQIAEGLRRVLEGMPVKIGELDHPIFITVSIGVSSCTEFGETPDALFGRADEALYRAKLAGKNRWALV